MPKKSFAPAPCVDETPPRCPRPYNLGQRKAAEDAARRRILETGTRLLIERGGAAFTMEAIAREAATTRQTIHNQFGTRTNLLEAVCEHAIHAEAFVAMPEVFQQRDPLEGADLFAEIMCRFWETNRLFVRRMRGLAQAEPELEALIRGHDERRLSALRGFVEHYRLASGDRAVRLVRVMFALTSFEFLEALSPDHALQENAASELKQLLRLCLRIRV
jgi:AcrR family transcriptional regulator